MNLNQLRYFVAAAESGSFTKASEKYYISQTAITQQIRALEDSVGCPLFDRSRRPLSLTPAGRVFLADAKEILERMNTAILRTREASAGFVGSLHLGYTKGYERSRLSSVLCEFHQKYPNIMVNCYRNSSDVLAEGLLTDDYDIIYSWDSTNLCQDETTDFRLIEKAGLVAALYPGHPLAGRKRLKREDLAHEKILYMSPSAKVDSYGDAHFLEMYQKAGYQPDIIFRSDDIESILMMVSAEEGISILPEYCTNKLYNPENLVFIPLVGEGEAEEIVAIWKKENRNPALEYFLGIAGI